MIDSMDIYRALKDTLTAQFNNIEVQTKDIKNPRPPCFYIKPVADNNSQTAADFETTDYIFSIVYISGTETLEDLLTVKEGIKRSFLNPLAVTSFDDNEDIHYVEINNLDITLNEDEYFFTASLSMQVTQPLSVKRFDSNTQYQMEEMELEIDSEM